MSLKEYAKKRDFRKTAEPSAVVNRGVQAAVLLFKSTMPHDCTMICDSSLAGTLKSWAVPKGFPYAKGRETSGRPS